MLASLKSLLETNMSTRNVVESYFKALEGKTGWEALLADTVAFTSFASPNRQITGKQPYIEATKRFYSTIQSFEVRGLIVEGSKACALTRYQLKGPNGTFRATSPRSLRFGMARSRRSAFTSTAHRSRSDLMKSG